MVKPRKNKKHLEAGHRKVPGAVISLQLPGASFYFGGRGDG